MHETAWLLSTVVAAVAAAAFVATAAGLAAPFLAATADTVCRRLGQAHDFARNPQP